MVYRISTQGGYEYYTAFADIELEGAEFWMTDWYTLDTVWSGLAGKTVYFFTNIGDGGTPVSNTPLPIVSGKGFPMYVGSITSATPVVTDADGFAAVTVNSTNKGTQYVYAVADYVENPQHGWPLKPYNNPAVADDGWQQLKWDSVTKTWDALGEDTVKVYAQGNVIGDQWANPVLDVTRLEDGTIVPAGQTTAALANPNRDTIAVQVFDTYGNALEDYRVEYEIMAPTFWAPDFTSGSYETYHPFAHFENAEWDYDEVTPAGVGDLDPGSNSNWFWGLRDYVDYITMGLGRDSGTIPDAQDDNYAWGWTKNHEINFKLNLASASHVDLVLDMTDDELARAAAITEADEFTNIVNIKIYRPDGTFWKMFEVTKVWSLEARVLTSAVLEQYDVPADDEELHQG